MRAVVIAAICLVGCYSPHYGDCEVSCASDVCPSGLECREGMCRVAGGSGACGLVTPDAAGSRDIPIEMLISEQRDALCSWLVRCHSFEDMASCQSTFGNQFGIPNLVEAVTAGKVIYHPEKARACVDSFEQSTCERARAFSNRDVNPVCNEVFTGTVAELATCYLDEECISQDCNNGNGCSMACCPGQCIGPTPPGRPTVGQRCYARDTCVDSYCATQMPIPMCTAYKEANTACSTSDECKPGLGCLGNPTMCRALTPTNGPCGSTSECATLADTCAGGMCRTGGLVGSICVSADNCQMQHVCSNPAQGMCQLLPTIGQSCQNYPVCREGYCDATMTCVEKIANGLPCSAANGSNECASGYCNAGKCDARPVCI